MTREQQAAQQAEQLIVFADGCEEAGLVTYARKARVVARETLWLVETLANERSARQAIQTQRDECLELLGKGVYDACKVEA